MHHPGAAVMSTRPTPFTGFCTREDATGSESIGTTGGSPISIDDATGAVGTSGGALCWGTGSAAVECTTGVPMPRATAHVMMIERSVTIAPIATKSAMGGERMM